MRIIKKIIIAIIVLGLLIGLAWEYYGIDKLNNYTELNTYVKNQKVSEVEAKELINLLGKVEYYQPLYNIKFPKLYRLLNSAGRKDASKERADLIYSYLQDEIKFKKLHILDIGSSLGYMPLYFSDKDHGSNITLGIDVNPYNVNISRILAKINKLPNANFEIAEFNPEYIENMSNSYDVAFIFSVLHHINFNHGLEYTQNLVVKLLDKVPLLFIEFAIAEEKVNFPWRETLPEDPLVFFAKCSDCKVEKLGEFNTHLSDVKRPLYVVKKKLS